MLHKWIEDAKNGKPVWVNEVRETLDREQSGSKVVFELTLFDGGRKTFTHIFPKWTNEEEKIFASDYLNAVVYNMLCAFGGQKLCCYFDTGDNQLAELFSEMKKQFMAGEKTRFGYGKILSEADRVCRFLGFGEFRFEERDLAEYRGQQSEAASAECSGEIKAHSSGSSLKKALISAGETAEKGIRCGIDIGGTDIKVAVSENGRLTNIKEYDWNPSVYRTAEETINPIISLAKEFLKEGCAYSSIGISFPDVVIRDRILGGETPKTKGLRESAGDYEHEFAKITALNEELNQLCTNGGNIRIINDGNMAAYSAALELAYHGEEAVEKGILAHSIGTSLGSGWLLPNGKIPEYTLEMYDFIIDIGSYPERALGAEDIRCVRNANSGLQGADRYAGQAAAFRYAYKLKKELLEAFVSEENGEVHIGNAESDLRKPCLEHLMKCAGDGDKEAQQIFRNIGENFARVSVEMQELFKAETDVRFVFGRFVKRKKCFDLIREGFESVLKDIRLVPADEDMAYSPLMLQLAERKDATVAQFGQAVGAIYYGAAE